MLRLSDLVIKSGIRCYSKLKTNAGNVRELDTATHKMKLFNHTTTATNVKVYKKKVYSLFPSDIPNEDIAIKVLSKFNMKFDSFNENAESKVIKKKINDIISENMDNTGYNNLCSKQQFEAVIKEVNRECIRNDIQLIDAAIEYKYLYPTIIDSIIYTHKNNGSSKLPNNDDNDDSLKGSPSNNSDNIKWILNKLNFAEREKTDIQIVTFLIILCVIMPVLVIVKKSRIYKYR